MGYYGSFKNLNYRLVSYMKNREIACKNPNLNYGFGLLHEISGLMISSQFPWLKAKLIIKIIFSGGSAPCTPAPAESYFMKWRNIIPTKNSVTTLDL